MRNPLNQIPPLFKLVKKILTFFEFVRRKLLLSKFFFCCCVSDEFQIIIDMGIGKANISQRLAGCQSINALDIKKKTTKNIGNKSKIFSFYLFELESLAFT